MDSYTRVALVRVGAPLKHDVTLPEEYHLGDHLGSSNVVTDSVGALINREEYTPYGETSYGSFARKRYRFSGKERGEENGLYYHGARFFAPWLARWMSCDPIGVNDGASLYRFVRHNPLVWVDPHGTQEYSSAAQQVCKSAAEEDQQCSELNNWVDQASYNDEQRRAAADRGELKVPQFDATEWFKNVSAKLRHTETLSYKLPLWQKLGMEDIEAAEKQHEAEVKKDMPGPVLEYTPVIGEGKSAYARFRHGDYFIGTLHLGMAVTDAIGWKSIVVGGVKMVGANLFKNVLEHTSEEVPGAVFRNAYTVAYQTKISPLGFGERWSHRLQANMNLLEDMAQHEELRNAMDALGRCEQPARVLPPLPLHAGGYGTTKSKKG
jgi:RHS repeat-associated protein